ncbi:MAG: DUF2085 domain-containing protein [Anaerolineae bacterium]|nr:DUF2085 domain-containing protein [Anaerolineae bacterium]
MEGRPDRPAISKGKRAVVLYLDRQIYRLARHWLAAFNLLIGLYLMLPFLAPVFMVSDAPQLGRLIYAAYRPACHQLPERSVFLFGPQTSYTLEELWALDVVDPEDNIYARQRTLGAPHVGYKAALCQRDLALYGGLFVGGLLFGLVRRRLRPLSLIGYLLCLVPIAIDGGSQLIGLRESTPLLRFLTGGLLGLATVWMLYPRLEDAFFDVGSQAQAHLPES